MKWSWNKQPPWNPKREGRFLIYPNGYKVDRYLLITYGTVMIFLLSYALLTIPGNFTKNWYAHCPGPGVCQNPFYCGMGGDCIGGVGSCPDNLCYRETLPAGYEYGIPPPPLMDAIFLWILLGTVLLALLNHFLWNKNFQFQEVE